MNADWLMYWFPFETCFNYLFVSRHVFRGFLENNELYACVFWLKQMFKPSWHCLVQNQRQKYYKIVQNLFKDNKTTMKTTKRCQWRWSEVFIVICWTCYSPGVSIPIVDLKHEKYANVNMDYITVILSKTLDSESSKATLLYEKEIIFHYGTCFYKTSILY